ncbi:hypothetical protein E4T56_gene9125, partial [Termitomyces sp. T112]
IFHFWMPSYFIVYLPIEYEDIRLSLLFSGFSLFLCEKPAATVISTDTNFGPIPDGITIFADT